MTDEEQAELRRLQDPASWDWETAELVGPSPRPGAVVSVRMSSEEFQRVSRAARRAEMPTTEFIRAAALVRASESLPVEADADRLTTVVDQLIRLIGGSFPRNGETIPVVDLILLSIQEKNLSVLIALRQLATRPNMGSASMILTRTIIEAAVGLEYMRAKGLDETIQQFWLFNYAGAKEDVEFLRKQGVDLTAEGLDEFATRVDQGVAEHKQELTFRGDELARSWAKMDCERMIEWLAEHDVLAQDGVRGIKQLYRLGSRHTHLSPTPMITYLLDDDRFRDADAWERRTALSQGVGYMATIATVVAQRRGNEHLVEQIAALVEPLREAEAS